jgi:hypothetical protein
MNAIKNVEPQVAAGAIESPAIESVKIVDGQHRMLAVSWARGRRKGRVDVVSLSPLIDTHKFYAPLRRNLELFETVRVIDDGYALAWVNGSIDMSASSVERLAEEAMTGKDFNEFLQRNALTHQAAAAALGRSKRQIENYLQYATLPRMVVLACIGYETRARVECTFSSRDDAVEAAKAMAGISVRSHYERSMVCCHYAGSLPSGNNPYVWTLPAIAIKAKSFDHGD